MIQAQNIKNMTDLRLDPSGVIKLVQESDDPVYIFNRGKPASVMLDVTQYEEMIEKLEDALDALEMKQFEKQQKKKEEWISHDELIKKLK